jgi:hypothetical protein
MEPPLEGAAVAELLATLVWELAIALVQAGIIALAHHVFTNATSAAASV